MHGKDEIDQDLPSRLAGVRAQSGLGYLRFAREIEERGGYVMAHTTVRKYESGQTDPPAGYILAVAEAFPQYVPTAAWLLTGEEFVLPGEAEAKIDAIRRIVLGGQGGGEAMAVVRGDRAARSLLPRYHKKTAGGEGGGG